MISEGSVGLLIDGMGPCVSVYLIPPFLYAVMFSVKYTTGLALVHTCLPFVIVDVIVVIVCISSYRSLSPGKL